MKKIVFSLLVASLFAGGGTFSCAQSTDKPAGVTDSTRLDALEAEVRALRIALEEATAPDTYPSVPETYTFAGELVRFNTPDRIERMDRELLAFTYMHSTSILMLKRSTRYFPQIEPILASQGVPDDLKYLMVIESNLNPKALSSAGAAGLWQFTKSTAKAAGLEVNDEVDERYNIEKETYAACKHLKEAYAKYGNWMTAMASYNGGMNGMTRKLRDQHQTNALDLWLVEETARYMYRVMAAKMLFENPAAFGFHLDDKDFYPYCPPRKIESVSTGIPSLVGYAEKHKTTYAKLKAENLWLRDTTLVNKAKKTYQIRIP